MVDLHERLSEFTYGYGVIKEVESLLQGIGVKTTPFLPSLIHEASLGFDVSFSGKGTPLLLQFKLGESLRRFVRIDRAETVPDLDRPFWRFWLDTAEPDGQFETLLKAEQDGSEVYYVAPRFVDWSGYLSVFEAGAVLERSLLITPSVVRQQLVDQGKPDGWHRIVYDNDNSYVCSTPMHIKSVGPRELAERLKARISDQPTTLGENIRRVFHGLNERALVRREAEEPKAGQPETVEPHVTRVLRLPVYHTERDRQRRLEVFRARAKSEDDAVAAALGSELWSLGIQMIFATGD